MDKPSQSILARRISFRQLQVFESVARNKSFTRAAEELFLSQPTISMQIKKLEESIDGALFDQVGKKIFLTEIGKFLHSRSREMLETLAQFETQVAELKGMKRGHLRLAVVTTAKYYTPYILGLFCQKYPGIDVYLKVTNRDHLLERLDGNLDDLYLIGQPPSDSNYHFEHLVDNPLVVVAARNHPVAKLEAPLSVNDITKQDFIVRETGSGTRKAVETFFKTHQKNINIRMELGSNEAIKQTVASGLGISILSRHTLAMGSRSGPIIEIDAQGFPLSWPWYIGYQTQKGLSVVARTFLDFVKDKRPANLNENVAEASLEN